MLWLVGWILVAALGIGGIVASANSLAFGRRVAREARAMWADAEAAADLDRGRLEQLPEPVRRYLVLALGNRERPFRTVRLLHGGTFRPRLDGGWLPIRGRQYFAADPPGFVWWGRVTLVPGIWIEARDRCVGGAGNMRISFESTITLADASGPAVDQGALLRLLGEMAWMPTALLDRRYVTWSAIDDHSARATLRLSGHEVSGVFAFGPDGLPARFTAERHRDTGDGTSVLTPFSAECRDYREVAGVLVPHQMIAAWHIDGKRIPYVQFEVERIEFDAGEPFR